MDKTEDLGLTEPEIISCVFLSGARTWVEGGIMRFVGWTEEDGERRVRIRYAIPVGVAQELHVRNRKVLTGRGH